MNNNEDPRPVGAAGDATESDPVSGVIESIFVAKVRAAFISKATPHPWPKRFKVKEREKALAETAAAYRALFLKLERSKPMPKGAKGSAVQLLGEVVKETKWPSGKKGVELVPAEWRKKESRTFQRYEIACVMNILLLAYNNGSGGDPAGWPPQRPNSL